MADLLSPVKDYIAPGMSAAGMLLGAGGTAREVQGATLQARGAEIQAQGSRLAGQNVRLRGSRVRSAAEYEAAQLEDQAGQVVAASQRDAVTAQHQTALVQSRQLALAAASGASASDTTIVNVMARTAMEGAYRSGAAIYGGEDAARKLRMQAQAKRYEGAIAEETAINEQAAYELAARGHEVQAGAARTLGSALQTRGGASLLAGAGSLFEKYGKGWFTSSPGDGVILDAGSSTIGDMASLAELAIV